MFFIHHSQKMSFWNTIHIRQSVLENPLKRTSGETHVVPSQTTKGSSKSDLEPFGVPKKVFICCFGSISVHGKSQNSLEMVHFDPHYTLCTMRPAHCKREEVGLGLAEGAPAFLKRTGIRTPFTPFTPFTSVHSSASLTTKWPDHTHAPASMGCCMLDCSTLQKRLAPDRSVV